MARLTHDDKHAILQAFTSMQRTDYISLDDTDKLKALANYYVDYFNNLPLLLQEQDHIVVGRRGTGKSTLLYRAYVECLHSWEEGYIQAPYRATVLERVLPVYIDLNQCLGVIKENLEDGELESAFLNEVVRHLADQVTRFWPRPTGLTAKLEKVFGKSTPTKVHEAVEALADTLISGKPILSKKAQVERELEAKRLHKSGTQADTSKMSTILEEASEESERGKESFELTFMYTAGEFLAGLRRLKQEANISAIMIFIDEFSALDRLRQRRIAKVLKALLGNKSGIFFKVSAITDRFDVGDILIPRDLTPISLDVDTMLAGANSLPEGMKMLQEMIQNIIEIRLDAFAGGRVTLESIFMDPAVSMQDLARAAMGVTRTIGYALQKAWARVMVKDNPVMDKNDVLYGIKSVGAIYLDTFLGAVKAGALPPYQGDIWNTLISRAQKERKKVPDKSASHFHVLPYRETHLAKLSEYLLVHLVVKGRTTKKDKTTRHLYCFDYGACLEFNLGYSTDRNTVRQERFVYDDELTPFDNEFDIRAETLYTCRRCQLGYTKDQLFLEKLGIYLDQCPRCHNPLEEQNPLAIPDDCTEEEAKILGAIYAVRGPIGKLAREIADEVGCYVQKVASYGQKLERMGRIVRDYDHEEGRIRYRPKINPYNSPV